MFIKKNKNTSDYKRTDTVMKRYLNTPHSSIERTFRQKIIHKDILEVNNTMDLPDKFIDYSILL
jgi:hypothetical protein